MSKMKLYHCILVVLLAATMTSSQQQTEEELKKELEDLATENNLDAG